MKRSHGSTMIHMAVSNHFWVPQNGWWKSWKTPINPWMLWREKIPPVFGGNIHKNSLPENLWKQIWWLQEFVGKICRWRLQQMLQQRSERPREAPEEPNRVFRRGRREISLVVGSLYTIAMWRFLKKVKNWWVFQLGMCFFMFFFKCDSCQTCESCGHHVPLVERSWRKMWRSVRVRRRNLMRLWRRRRAVRDGMLETSKKRGAC